MDFLRYYIYYILLHLTLAGSSLIQVGDAISVSLDSSATLRYSSNILKTETNELSDNIYIISPGAVVNFGKPGTMLDLRLRAYNDIIKYKDYSDLDINTSKVYVDGSYNPSDVISSSFSYSNEEGRTAKSDEDLPGAPALIETEREKVSFNANYRYSPKFSFSFGISQSELTFGPDVYSDQLSSIKGTTVPLSIVYHYSNKLSLFCGVTRTDREIGERDAYFNGSTTAIPLPSYETDSLYYNIGLKGTIMPKLTGQFSVGYNTLNYSTVTNDFNAFGASGSLTWTHSPKLKTTIDFSRDFDASGTGSTYRGTRGYLSSTYKLNNDFSLLLRLGGSGKYYKSNPIRQGEATGRGEKFYDASLNLYYTPSNNYNVILGYNYIESDAITDYDIDQFMLKVRLKY